MSSSALPGSFPPQICPSRSPDPALIAAASPLARPRGAGSLIRRRGSLAQGRALEGLGHAVEYLVDSRLFHTGEHNQRDENEAIQTLMRLSRAVFSECPEVVPLSQRVRGWVSERIAGVWSAQG